MPEVALSARGLDKRFGGLKAVSGVSLDVHTGEIHAVIGPNGAGKSTLVNLISGDLRATSGTIAVGGVDVTRIAPEARALAGLGRCYQKTTIFSGASTFDNVRLAAQAHARRPLRMFADANSDSAVNEQARRALSVVGLEGRGEVTAASCRDGIRAAIPPMAWTLLRWQVRTSSCVYARMKGCSMVTCDRSGSCSIR